ncbi:MAG: hypothetical protein JW394_0661 [Nitrospira sp.]|nr:hypothetical protein [Nitrospira sp.]
MPRQRRRNRSATLWSLSFFSSFLRSYRQTDHPPPHLCPLMRHAPLPLPSSYLKKLEEKILLAAQTLIYQSHTVQHFYTEGGESLGNEESSKEENSKEEEEVVVQLRRRRPRRLLNSLLPDTSQSPPSSHTQPTARKILPQNFRSRQPPTEHSLQKVTPSKTGPSSV